MKRKDQVIPHDFVHNKIKVDRKDVYINPTTLFTPLVATAQREDDVSQYSIIPVTRTPDNSNSPYLELKLNPLALILLHNLPPITRTFVNSNHFHRSLGGSSYREYTVLSI